MTRRTFAIRLAIREITSLLAVSSTEWVFLLDGGGKAPKYLAAGFPMDVSGGV